MTCQLCHLKGRFNSWARGGQRPAPKADQKTGTHPSPPRGVTPDSRTRRTDHTPPCRCTLPRPRSAQLRPPGATTPGPTHAHHLDDRPAYPRRSPRTRSATTRPARRAGNRTTSTPASSTTPRRQLDHPGHPTAPQRRRTPPRQGSAGRGTPRWTSRRGHTDLDARTVPGQHSVCEVRHTTGERHHAHPHASGNLPTPVPLDDAGQNLDSTNTAGVCTSTTLTQLDDVRLPLPRQRGPPPPRQRGTPPPRRRQASRRPPRTTHHHAPPQQRGDHSTAGTAVQRPAPASAGRDPVCVGERGLRRLDSRTAPHRTLDRATGVCTSTNGGPRSRATGVRARKRGIRRFRTGLCQGKTPCVRPDTEHHRRSEYVFSRLCVCVRLPRKGISMHMELYIHSPPLHLLLLIDISDTLTQIV